MAARPDVDWVASERQGGFSHRLEVGERNVIRDGVAVALGSQLSSELLLFEAQ